MFNVPDAPTNLHVVVGPGHFSIGQKLVMTPVMIAIMLGAYLIALMLWDRINERLELKRALKEYKKNFGC